MKRFLKYIVLFSLPILVLAAIGEVYVESRPNVARNKHEWMVANSSKVRTLVLGSSHTYYGLKTSCLGDDAYSLAQVSQTYRYDNYLLRHYPMPCLKTVIIPFSYFSLWEDMESQPSLESDIVRYRLYMDCDIHSRVSRYGLELFMLPAFCEKLKSIFTPRKMHWDKQGWGTEYTFENRPTEWDNGEQRAKKNTYIGQADSIVALNVAFLDDMISFCEKRGVEVILLTTPVTKSFLSNENPRQVEINRSMLQSVLKNHTNVKRLDLESDARFTDADFYDADHLNTRGAEKLGQIVARWKVSTDSRNIFTKRAY